MTPERWQQVNELFTAVVELEPERRDAFLDESCSDDYMLRREVESLLASAQRGWGDLIERPALEVAAPLLFVNEQPELMSGQSIGRYEIVRLIGKGGMGEVYLATDTLLNRKIALKLVPFDYTRDINRLRRFKHEAQAASALNHPNILTIYEIGQSEDRPFISTEFVDGETLRQRLKRTVLTLGESLEIGIQVASALTAAHRAGIVHRDIKPENIMLRPDGYVKVLDFGLAKLTEHNEPNSATQAVESPALSSDLLIGTVKYMSPEQAMGLHVDSRSDIFSLGVVLYEMVTGQTPFTGKTTNDLIAAILSQEPPPLTQFSKEAPEELQEIICSALRKDREERYDSISQLLDDLRSLKDNLTRDKRSRDGFILNRIRLHKSWTVATASMLFIAVLGTGYLTYKRLVLDRTAFSKNVELALMTTSGDARFAAVSPDGRYVAYINGTSLWTREVATNRQAELIPTHEGEYLGLTFSPDGNDLYYVEELNTDADSPSLFRIPVTGGVPTKLIPNMFNTSIGNNPVSFSPDGTRLAFVREYQPDETALIVANVDGTNERKLAVRHSHTYFGSAAWSPDGKRIVCKGGYKDNKTVHSELVAIEVEDGVEKPVNTRDFYYIGDIAWMADGRSLLLIANERESQPTQVWEISYPTGTARRVSADLNSYSGLSLSADSGVLVTVRGQTTMNIWTQSADGGESKQITSGPALSDGKAGIGWTPDGRVVYSSNASGRQDIWIMNADGSHRKQLTLDLGTDRNGLSVSPDGRYVAFVSNERGADNIWRVNADGTNPKPLTNGNGELHPAFSPDGQWVTYRLSGDSGKPVTWRVPVDGGEPELVASQSGGVESRVRQPLVTSPDGSLVAYIIPPDAQSKKNRIGVGSIDGGDPIRILDLQLGHASLQHMRWTPDGRALTYFDDRGGVPNIWIQPLDGSPARQLTDFKPDSPFNSISNFDWSRDGTRLAIVRKSHSSDAVLMKDFR
jgi:serine/threonine protein kinase